MEVLNEDNIISDLDIENLFIDSDSKEPEEDKAKSQDNKATESPKEDTKSTEDIFLNNSEDFNFEDSESVGSEDESQESTNSAGTSKNFFSSLAYSLKQEGILPDLSDEDLKNVKESKDITKLFDSYIASKMDEKQKRIDDALNLGVDASDIKKYENAISYIDSITDDQISNEGQEGENLRKQLIYQDFMNRGYTKERAIKEVQKSFNAGTDIEDAKDALTSNRDYYKECYEDLIEEAREAKKRVQEDIARRTEAFKKNVLESDKVFGDIVIDTATKKAALDAVLKPQYKDSKGNMITAVQKYQQEHSDEFLKNIGIIYALTNGFTDLNKIVQSKVKTATKNAYRELENKINNSRRNSDGNLVFTSGVSDTESSFNWRLDV